MLNVKAILFKRLTQTDLDVLENNPRSKTQTYIELPKGSLELLGSISPIEWNTPEKGSPEGSMKGIIGGKDKSATEEKIDLTLSLQATETRKSTVRIKYLRNSGPRVWTEPVRTTRPQEDKALLMLIRASDDRVYARFISSIDSMPEAMQSRISRVRLRADVIDFSSEGQVIVADPWVARVTEALKARRNVILYGPPGTGKTRLMTVMRGVFSRGVTSLGFDPDDLGQPFKVSTGPSGFAKNPELAMTEWVTFHQSYSYESFVSGLRPEIVSGALTYRVAKGPVIELAENAMKDGGASFLLIDELNRGNTAEILGELITVLEKNKRRGAEEEIGVRLPYPPSPSDSSVIDPVTHKFFLPDKFYLLASMNSVDRSVAPLDSALRRRFDLIEIPPDIGALSSQASRIRSDYENLPESLASFEKLQKLACNLLETINERIGVLRGSDFMLGQGYLWEVFESSSPGPSISISEREGRLIRAFSQAILPQIREIFHDDPAAVTYILRDANKGKLFQIVAVDESDELSFESNGFVRWTIPALTDTALWMECLRLIAPIKEDEEEEVTDEDENHDEDDSK